MKNTALLLGSTTAALLSIDSAYANQQDKKPNIILIMVDDMGVF